MRARSWWKPLVILTWALFSLGPVGQAQESGRGEKNVITASEIIDILGKEPMRMRGVGPMKESPRLAFSILFASNSDQISKASVPQLDEMGKALASEKLSSFSFAVEGHTDYVGSDAYNDRLSRQRAESVKRYLVKKFDLSAERLVPKGYGKRQPIAFGKDEDSKARNRRVELVRKDVESEGQSSPKPSSSPHPSSHPSSSSSNSGLSLEVSFLYQAEGYKFGKMQEGMTLGSGDQYKIYFRPRQECYVYVIQVDSKGAYLLFPNPEYHSQGNPLTAQEEYWLPEDKLFTRFLSLDDTPGSEMLYLVALRKPAPDIEELLQRLQTPLEPGEKKLVMRGLEDQIQLRGTVGPRPGREIQKQVSRPGSLQKTPIRVSTQVLEKAGTGLYARISFRHKGKAASRLETQDRD